MDNKHFYFETLLVCYFVPQNVFFDSEKKLNNYVPRLGNYKILQKKSSKLLCKVRNGGNLAFQILKESSVNDSTIPTRLFLWYLLLLV